MLTDKRSIFISSWKGSDKDVKGRPVGTFVHNDGSLLVTDDDSGIVWRVSAE